MRDRKCAAHLDVAIELGSDLLDTWSIPYATEIHHMAGRNGKLLNDETRFLPVCSKCHRFLTDHAQWAIEKGLSQRINYR